MVSIGKQQFGPVCALYGIVRKKRDITSLLGQMCPPAASLTSFRKLGPIVPSCAGWVIGTCKLPMAAIGGACLVMVNGASSLDRGCRRWLRKGTGQWHWQQQWRGRLWGEGAFGGFGSLAGQRVLVTAMAMIVLGHVGVINGTVVSIVGVPLGQDAVGVVAIDMWSWTVTLFSAYCMI
jgi:hypothetical protein